ncbi:TetR/AcrR family transcriptional regulator [Mycolicibacterium sp.]|uniref:TetR/AcrR family transcriptional regulator n=1 Tax=Mycolicibacterium sp. TaxID=2320850 RepID=UPI003D0B121B
MFTTKGAPCRPAERRELRQDRARERVERILSATSEVLREGGLELLTTSRVAERAGSTLPSVYRYFPDRTHLVRAVAEHYLDAIYDRLAADLVGLRTAEDARAALETALRNYYQAFIDDPALREIWAGTIADRALLGLNIADSQRNGAVLADRLRPFSTLDTEALLRRCVLVAHLAQATVVFAVALDSSEGPSYVDEFGAWATDLLQG